MFAPGTYRIAADLLRIWGDDGKVIATRAWGDRLTVTAGDANGVDVFIGQPGRVKKPAQTALVPIDVARAPKILRIDFVDVQQGDAAVLETPGGTTLVVDGGENVQFSRYMAARYSRTTVDRPQRIDCMVVTHGDADHFAGLTEIFKTESAASKRVFIAPDRIFHNGLVKRTASPELGRRDGGVLTELHDDLRPLADNVMNAGFRKWRDAVKVWSARSPTFQMRRLQRGDDAQFAFLAPEGVTVQVLGPITVPAGAGVGLPWLGSVGETINGHSVVLLVRFGNVRFLLAGDLNTAAEKAFVADHDAKLIDLQAEVLKVPHHGSADYLPEFLQRVAPGVSVVSSGDEGASDHIHPRATLVGALGRYARPELPRPVIFITELAAFFRFVSATGRFEREAYGIVRCRTDGKRLLVYTESGEKGENEAYAFTVAADGTMKESRVTIVR